MPFPNNTDELRSALTEMRSRGASQQKLRVIFNEFQRRQAEVEEPRPEEIPATTQLGAQDIQKEPTRLETAVTGAKGAVTGVVEAAKGFGETVGQAAATVLQPEEIDQQLTESSERQREALEIFRSDPTPENRELLKGATERLGQATEQIQEITPTKAPSEIVGEATTLPAALFPVLTPIIGTIAGAAQPEVEALISKPDVQAGLQEVERLVNENPKTAIALSGLFELIGGGTAKRAVTQAQKIGVRATRQVAKPAGEALEASRLGKVAEIRAEAAEIKPSIAEKVAVREAIELPVSATAEQPIVALAETATAKGFFGGKVTAQVEKAVEGVRRFSDKIVQDIGTKKTPKEIGEGVQKGFADFKDNFNQTKTQLYNDVAPLLRGQISSTPGTLKSLDSIIENLSKAKVPTNVKFFKDLKNNFSGDIDFENLKATRTEIGSKIKNINDPVATGNPAQLRKLFASLSEDMDTAAKNVSPEVAAQFKKANDFFREGVNKLNSKIGKKIQNIENPERLIDELIKPKSETTIPEVFEVIGKEQTENLKGAFLTKIIDNSVTPTGGISSSKISSQIKKFTEPTVKAVIGDKGLERLRELEEISRSLEKGQKIASGSQTAFLGKIGLATGTGFFNFPALVGIVLGDFAANRFFQSQLARRLFTKTGKIKSLIDKAEKLKEKPSLLERGIKKISRDKSFKTAGKPKASISVEKSLSKEAKEFKSAEEFVKSKGTPLFHGTPFSGIIKELKPGKGGFFGEGIYLSGDKKVAQQFLDNLGRDPTLEKISEGVFQNINTGEIINTGKPQLLKVFNVGKLNLKQITDPEHSKLLEVFREKSGKIDLDNARKKINDSFKKQGFDGLNVTPTKHFDERQVVIFPEAKNKLRLESQLINIFNKAKGK